MDPALHQTIAFILLLVVGLSLKWRIKDAKELNGIKTVILTVALPATIFLALLKIELSGSLMILPFLGFGANVILYFASRFVLNHLDRTISTIKKRTFLLLLPSFAPGLSCFPFVIEYLGDDALANAAIIDIGNKFFILIVLYLIAVQWFQSLHSNNSRNSGSRERIRLLLSSLVKEPINIVIVLALIFLIFGYNLDKLPLFLQQFLSQTHSLTTGLILLFIGVAFNIRGTNLAGIFGRLFLRSGIAFLLSAIALFIGKPEIINLALLIVIFPQSSCSFWPLAHMSSIEMMEGKDKAGISTFDIQLGLNIIACSLPLSSLIILGVCSTGHYFIDPVHCIIAAVSMLAAGFLLRYSREIFETRFEGGLVEIPEK
ncbi:MAG: permease [Saprospiraceae bacterium]|nr:permease [Saprospiraceae bacterium]